MTSGPHWPSRWLSLIALLPAVAQTSCGSQPDPSGVPSEESTGEVAEGLGSGFHVTTRAYNDQRTGANTSETALTSSNVNISTFGKLFSIIVDDQVYAQPLYASNVNVGGRVRNVVYIATVNNTVSAFDADIAGPPGTGNPPTLWSRNFNNGGRPPNHNDVGQPACGNGTYNDFSGNMGIVGTPVIDGGSNTLFVVTRTVEGGGHVQRLRALDIFSGNDRVAARTIGTINAQTNNQRAALALSQGKVYVAWSSHCDQGPYEGRVLAFNTGDLSQAASFSAGPGSQQSGIWMAGAAPPIDGSGNLIYATGNGTFDGSTHWGETLIKLSPTLGRVDSFTPSNFADLNAADLDLGSSGPVFLGSSRLVLGGKGGRSFDPNRNETKCYIVNASSMGGMVSGDTQIPQKWTCVDSEFQNTGATHHLHNSMVVWNGPSGTNLYTWGEGDFGRLWRFNGNNVNVPQASKSNVKPPNGMPGGMMSLSANGSSNGVLWVTMPLSGDANHSTVPGILRAIDANDLTRELWNSTVTVVDNPQNFTKGSAPVIANGKVYVPSLSNRVSVYGLTTTREAESVPATGTAGRVLRVFADTLASNGQGSILEGHAVGDFVSYTVNVPQAGTWGIRPRHKPSNNRGIWQLSIDGVNQGAPVDGFAGAPSYVELDLGTKALTAGNHTFRFAVTGKNGASSDFWIALDYFKLTRRGE
jgi:hypothetical protein